jgi:hypothetical protein
MPAASSGGGATGGGKGEGGARVARGPPVSPAGGDAGRVRCYNYSPHQCFGKYLRSIMVMPAYVCHILRQYRRSYTSDSTSRTYVEYIRWRSMMQMHRFRLGDMHVYMGIWLVCSL